jgi:hypothetical protein
MKDPRCIRIFTTSTAVEKAVKVLQHAHIEAYVTEDKFGTLTLTDLKMRPRFRLYIDKNDIDKAGKFLAGRLKQQKLQ